MPAAITPLSDSALAAILDRQGHEPCPGVELTSDIEIAAATPTSPRIYGAIFRPAVRQALPGPALLAYHGGGFGAGHPHGVGAIAKTLALTLGVTTIGVSYRLGTAEKPTWPGVTDDAATAWRWVQSHAAELGIDPARVAVSGESAGCLLAGHLAVRSQLVAQATNGLPAPAALISQWGPLDFVVRWFDNGENPGAEVNLFGPGGHHAHPHLYHHASVLTHARAQLPPGLFIYGRRDPVVHARQGRLGDAAWRDAGAHSELLILDNIGHGVSGDNREQRRTFLEKIVAFSAWRWA